MHKIYTPDYIDNLTCYLLHMWLTLGAKNSLNHWHMTWIWRLFNKETIMLGFKPFKPLNDFSRAFYL